MTPLKKVAIFLMMLEKDIAQSVIANMDNSEIKAVVGEIRQLTKLEPSAAESILSEFEALGFQQAMNPAEILTVMRFLFNGGNICR